MEDNKVKNGEMLILITLLLVLVIIIIGYAALSQAVQIKGIDNTEEQWNIESTKADQ